MSRLPLLPALILLLVLSGCAQASQSTATRPIATVPATTSEPTTTTTETATADQPTPPPTTAATDSAAEVATEEPAAETATEAPAPTPTQVPPGRTDAVGLQLVAEGLTSPVALIPVPDGSGRLFVADQIGLIRVLTADGELRPDPFLDLRPRMVTLMEGFDERGFLGLAFHPNYAENGRFFVYYSAPLRPGAPADWDHTSHLSQFNVSADDPNVADPGSEQILLQVDQPQFNHDAGQITFGPDGYLYVALGDGGNANDVGPGHVADWYATNAGGNGQDTEQNLLGTILRIDVDRQGADGRAYTIPEDNPFVGVPGMEDVAETWAYGFRNPFRISFDMGGNHDLFAGDVGQDLWEEVSIVTKGGNYGWNVKEGSHCFSTGNPGQSLDDCPATTADGQPLIDPVIEYANAKNGGIGLSVIGGFVYRGNAMPQFQGQYLFGDWSTNFGQGDGTLLAATPGSANEMWSVRQLTVATNDNGRLNAFLLSFGQDAQGELYALTTERPGPTGSTGKIYKLISVR